MRPVRPLNNQHVTDTLHRIIRHSTPNGLLREFGDQFDPPISAQAVHEWVTLGRVPAARVPAILAMAPPGLAITAHDLAPDVFPAEAS